MQWNYFHRTIESFQLEDSWRPSGPTLLQWAGIPSTPSSAHSPIQPDFECLQELGIHHMFLPHILTSSGKFTISKFFRDFLFCTVFLQYCCMFSSVWTYFDCSGFFCPSSSGAHCKGGCSGHTAPHFLHSTAFQQGINLKWSALAVSGNRQRSSAPAFAWIKNAKTLKCRFSYITNPRIFPQPTLLPFLCPVTINPEILFHCFFPLGKRDSVQTQQTKMRGNGLKLLQSRGVQVGY